MALASRVNRCSHGDLVDHGYVSRAMVSVLTISGMLAVHAKRAVFTALAGVPGVVSAEVEMGRAVVVHEPTTSAAALSEAIAAIGCDVTSVRTERRLPLSD